MKSWSQVKLSCTDVHYKAATWDCYRRHQTLCQHDNEEMAAISIRHVSMSIQLNLEAHREEEAWLVCC